MTNSQEFDVSQHFNTLLRNDENLSPAIAAIQTLLEYIKNPSFGTLAEIREKVIQAIDRLTRTDSSVISVKSGCEMLLRFITLTAEDTEVQMDMKQLLLERGQIFLKRASMARKKIAKLALPFITYGSKILIYSYSRVVLEILKEAIAKNGNIKVYITESCPDKSGHKMRDELSKLAGINVSLILDSSVGSIIENVDFVLLGAEGVVESGGIINKIGTSTIGICAKMLNKPVYVAVESFKFVRTYPLNNRDIPDDFKFKYSTIQSKTDLKNEHPLIDYTHPSFITLLFTDIGILTPSAVSDELVSLYL
jgi:translation initiation factor eIF-2B subunit alpha